MSFKQQPIRGHQQHNYSTLDSEPTCFQGCSFSLFFFFCLVLQLCLLEKFRQSTQKHSNTVSKNSPACHPILVLWRLLDVGPAPSVRCRQEHLLWWQRRVTSVCLALLTSRHAWRRASRPHRATLQGDKEIPASHCPSERHPRAQRSENRPQQQNGTQLKAEFQPQNSRERRRPRPLR